MTREQIAELRQMTFDCHRMLGPNSAKIRRVFDEREALLDALRWALQYGRFDGAEDNPLHGRALDEARAAIAKAEAE